MVKIEQSGCTAYVDDAVAAERVANAWAQVDPWHTVTVTSEDGASHVV